MSTRNKSGSSPQNCMNGKGGKVQLAAACTESTVEERTSVWHTSRQTQFKRNPNRQNFFLWILSDYIDPSFKETYKKGTNLSHSLWAKMILCLDSGFMNYELDLWSPGPVILVYLKLPLLLNPANNSLQDPREVWQSWFQCVLYAWC